MVWEAVAACCGTRPQSKKGNSLMASNKQELKTAIFEDGTCAVLRADPATPHLLEVIATFHDAARARDYVRQNNSSGEHQEKRPAIKQASAAKPRQASKAEPVRTSATKPKPATQTKPKLASAAKPIPAAQAKPKTAATDMS